MATTITKSILKRPTAGGNANTRDNDPNTYYNYSSSLNTSITSYYDSFGIPANATVIKAIIAAKIASNTTQNNVSLKFGYNEYSDNQFLSKKIIDKVTCEPQYFYNERTATEITEKLTSLGIHGGNIISYFNDTDNNCQTVIGYMPTSTVFKKSDIDVYDVYMEVFYTVPAYTLTVTAGTGGTVSGGGNYEAGTTATLKATPNTGYKFVKWVNASGTTVSTSATYSLSVTADTTLTAVFEKLTYTITFKNEDGTILQASSVAYGDTPKYTGATPTKASTAEYSYSFSGWSPSIASVTGAVTYTAQFTATIRSYIITANAGTGGTVTGGGAYNYGSSATLTANANEGYVFKQWHDGNKSNPRTINVTGTATYTAEFEIPAIKQVYIGTSLVEVYRGTSLFKEIYAGTSKTYKP